MQMAARFQLAAILSTDNALRSLGKFDFVASQILSAGRRHLSAVADLLLIIETMEELHTEVQGMISSPHLAMTLLYDVLW